MFLFSLPSGELLDLCFAGFGCDKAAVINILSHRDATQRALIQQEYRTMYSEDLNKRLVKELSGKLEVLMEGRNFWDNFAKSIICNKQEL